MEIGVEEIRYRRATGDEIVGRNCTNVWYF